MIQEPQVKGIHDSGEDADDDVNGIKGKKIPAQISCAPRQYGAQYRHQKASCKQDDPPLSKPS